MEVTSNGMAQNSSSGFYQYLGSGLGAATPRTGTRISKRTWTCDHETRNPALPLKWLHYEGNGPYRRIKKWKANMFDKRKQTRNRGETCTFKHLKFPPRRDVVTAAIFSFPFFSIELLQRSAISSHVPYSIIKRGSETFRVSVTYGKLHTPALDGSSQHKYCRVCIGLTKEIVACSISWRANVVLFFCLLVDALFAGYIFESACVCVVFESTPPPLLYQHSHFFFCETIFFFSQFSLPASETSCWPWLRVTLFFITVNTWRKPSANESWLCLVSFEFCSVPVLRNPKPNIGISLCHACRTCYSIYRSE